MPCCSCVSAQALRLLFMPPQQTNVNARFIPTFPLARKFSLGSINQRFASICGTAEPQFLLRMTSPRQKISAAHRTRESMKLPHTLLTQHFGAKFSLFSCPLLPPKNSACNLRSHAMQSTKPKTNTRNLHLTTNSSLSLTSPSWTNTRRKNRQTDPRKCRRGTYRRA